MTAPMIEHTKGPWTIITPNWPGGFEIAEAINEENEANARLIAVAPIQNSALESIAEMLDHAVNGGLNTASRRATVGDLKAVMRKARDEARDAIAKAKAKAKEE